MARLSLRPKASRAGHRKGSWRSFRLSHYCAIVGREPEIKLAYNNFVDFGYTKVVRATYILPK